ncbi:hypothetical protein ACWELQ_43575, partial [Nocardia sp. NPDC004722]
MGAGGKMHCPAVTPDAARLRVARAVAVLGNAAELDRVATLLEADIAEIRTVVTELANAGLIVGQCRAHPEMAARVLRELPPDQRRALHAAAAELLCRAGLPADVVAEHLVAAGDARGSWAAQVLLEVADDAYDADELDSAAAHLELAYRASRRADERAAIATRLVGVEWRLNPSSRTRNFGRLKAALRTGRVPAADLPMTVLQMLWHGYVLHADHALLRLRRAPDGAGADRLDFLGAWLRYTHPVTAQRHPWTEPDPPPPSQDPQLPGHDSTRTGRNSEVPGRDQGLPGRSSEPPGRDPVLRDRGSTLPGRGSPRPGRDSERPGRGSPPSGRDSAPPGPGSVFGGRDSAPPGRDSALLERDSPHRQAAALLRGLCEQRPAAATATAAQRILAQHRLTPATVEVLVAAVDCLLHTDRLDAADAWCTALLAEATARRAPTWQALFASARAETLLRKGNLEEAAGHATVALNLLPAEQLGVWLGRPIAVLVRARTAQGRHTEAAAQLERPVPRALFESRFALGYLRAHGEHCLATGRTEEALRHFRRCGRLMDEWGMDFPWLAPWRNDLATASLRAGQHWQAQNFATRHLDAIGGAEVHHTGGVSLRLLAATSDPLRRVTLLRRAAALARTGGDELELATVLADLGDAYRALGEADRAR